MLLFYILYLNGLKIYILTSIDLTTRQAFAYAYKTLSSLIAKDFCFKLRKVFIGQEILAIKTDNGSEFLKHFHQYLKSQNIIHFFIYPRKPQHNAYIERFNGILQKEFINHYFSLAFQNLEEFLIINCLIIFSGIIQKDHIIALILNILYNIQ
jgi:transposase InsO family protein